jgi:hypothetical protein
MQNGTDMMGVVANDVDNEADTIEIASATQGQWREYISGKKSWVITANTLVLSAGMSIGYKEPDLPVFLRIAFAMSVSVVS